MKKKNLLIYFLMLTFYSQAQPTLTDANFGYNVGDQFTFKSTTLPTYTTSSGHMWDFTSINGGQTLTANIVAPSTLAAGSNFPTANIAETYSTGGERFFNKTNSQLELVGMSISGILFTYSNPEISFKYPLTFGTSYSDTWACSFTSGIAFNRGGTTTVSADGYGTIKLPNGDYATVLKVNLNSVYADTSTAGIINYTTVVDHWCLEGKPFPITSHAVTTTSAGATTADQYMDPVGAVAVNNIQSLDHFIKFYPNPSDKIITITANKLSKVDGYRVVLSNMHGSNLASYEFNGNNIGIDVSSYPSGHYALELIGENGNKLAGQLTTVKHN